MATSGVHHASFPGIPPLLAPCFGRTAPDMGQSDEWAVCTCTDRWLAGNQLVSDLVLEVNPAVHHLASARSSRFWLSGVGQLVRLELLGGRGAQVVLGLSGLADVSRRRWGEGL